MPSLDRFALIQRAIEEQRTVLTQGQYYAAVSRRLAPGRCYRVQAKLPQEQLIEVLNCFSIKVARLLRAWWR